MKFHEAYEALVNGSAKKLRARAWALGMYAALNENENGVLYLYTAHGDGHPWDGAAMLQEGWEVVLSVDSPDKSFEQLVERLKTEPIDPLFMVDCVLRYAAANGVHPDHAHVIGRGASHELHQLVAEIATCDAKSDPKGILAAVRNFLLQRGYPDPEARRAEATPFDTLVEELRRILAPQGLESRCAVEAVFPYALARIISFCHTNHLPISPFFSGGADSTPELIELFEQLVGADAATRRFTGWTRGDAQRNMLDAWDHFFRQRGYPQMVAMVNVGADDSLPGRTVTDAEVEGLEEALRLGRRVVENVDPTQQLIEAAEKVRREIERAQRRYRSSDPVWIATSGIGASRFRWR